MPAGKEALDSVRRGHPTLGGIEKKGPTRFLDRSDLGYERRRGVKEASTLSHGLNLSPQQSKTVV